MKGVAWARCLSALAVAACPHRRPYVWVVLCLQVSHQLDRRPELRPTLPDELPVPYVAPVRGYVALMQDCWKTNPADRWAGLHNVV